MHLIVNCPRNSKIASKLRKVKRFLSYWSKTNILAVLIYNLKSAWPTEISMSFLSSLNIFSIRCILYFSKSCWLFWVRAQNMLIFGRRCSTPLKMQLASSIMSMCITYSKTIILQYACLVAADATHVWKYIKPIRRSKTKSFLYISIVSVPQTYLNNSGFYFPRFFACEWQGRKNGLRGDNCMLLAHRP